MLARANLTIGEADKFSSVLASQLQLLDGANIQSIMDSEAAVNDLITLVEDALEEADFLDKELDSFDELLYVSTPLRFAWFTMLYLFINYQNHCLILEWV